MFPGGFTREPNSCNWSFLLCSKEVYVVKELQLTDTLRIALLQREPNCALEQFPYLKQNFTFAEVIEEAGGTGYKRSWESFL